MNNEFDQHVPLLVPGSKVGVMVDGVVRTQRVTEVSYEPPTWGARPTLSRWRRFVRAITPARWRKPLLLGGYHPLTISFTADPDPFWRES